MSIRKPIITIFHLLHIYCFFAVVNRGGRSICNAAVAGHSPRNAKPRRYVEPRNEQSTVDSK
jgi:hypothetical protein